MKTGWVAYTSIRLGGKITANSTSRGDTISSTVAECTCRLTDLQTGCQVSITWCLPKMADSVSRAVMAQPLKMITADVMALVWAWPEGVPNWLGTTINTSEEKTSELQSIMR